MPTPDDQLQLLISGKTARQIAGGVSAMTLWRWIRDGIIPEPRKIRGRNYWKRDEFIAAINSAADTDNTQSAA